MKLKRTEKGFQLNIKLPWGEFATGFFTCRCPGFYHWMRRERLVNPDQFPPGSWHIRLWRFAAGFKAKG